MKDAIKISGLKKSYGSKLVLGGLDFQIKQGEIFALLGSCKWENRNSTTVLLSTRPHQTDGSHKTLCKMESYTH